MVDVLEPVSDRRAASDVKSISQSVPRLRLRPQRPVRVMAAGLLIVVSVAVGLTVFSRLDDHQEVLVLQRTVLAGERVTDADLGVVSLSSDGRFAAVPASQRGAVIGQYARVRMVQGALLVADAVQSRPLVDPGKVLMSVPVAVTGVPSGLREGSRLVLIVMPKSSGTGANDSVLVEATVAALPPNLAQLLGGSSSTSQLVALSVEVPPDRVALIGSASAVAVGVLDPSAAFPPSVTASPSIAASATSSSSSTLASVTG